VLSSRVAWFVASSGMCRGRCPAREVEDGIGASTIGPWKKFSFNLIASEGTHLYQPPTTFPFTNNRQPIPAIRRNSQRIRKLKERRCSARGSGAQWPYDCARGYRYQRKPHLELCFAPELSQRLAMIASSFNIRKPLEPETKDNAVQEHPK
jgi:hypothetical protein